MSLLALLSLVPSATAAEGCYPDEPVVFSCETAGGKWVSVCAGPAAPSSIWVKYRFGPLGKPEFTYPTDTAVGFTPFRLATTPIVSGESTTFSFTVDGATFEVFQSVGSGEVANAAGVNVTKGGTLLRTVACTGPVTADWASIAQQMMPGSTLIGSVGTTPDPLGNKSQKEICEDDALLLLQHPYAKLSTGGFSEVCCTANTLGSDDPRCNLDWPVNDVPFCSHFDQLRNKMFAFYGYPFQKAQWADQFGKETWYVKRDDFQASWMPAVATANIAILKGIVEKKEVCIVE